MEKVIYLLWGPGEAGVGEAGVGEAGVGEAGVGEALRHRLLVDTAPALLGGGARRLTVGVHDAAAAAAPAPVPTPPDEAQHVAELSVWLDAYDRRAACDEAVADVGLRWAAYLVVESLVEDYGTTRHGPGRDWPDGARSPGVLTVALIHRPEGLDYREWVRRWHQVQSPLSAELQPRTRYVRNEVVRSLSAGAPDVHGIVDEAWPSAEHLADPMRFYSAGTAEELDDHVGRMLRSVTACLDLARLRSSTMSEYLVRS